MACATTKAIASASVSRTIFVVTVRRAGGLTRNAMKGGPKAGLRKRSVEDWGVLARARDSVPQPRFVDIEPRRLIRDREVFNS